MESAATAVAVVRTNSRRVNIRISSLPNRRGHPDHMARLLRPFGLLLGNVIIAAFQGGAHDMSTWILLAILAAAAIYVVAVFNRLVRQRNLVREGWSGIDVQLKRRTDLVPNLVETVKAYAAHERAVLEEVTAMRASSIAASGVGRQATAEQGLQASLGKLLAVAEAYPELKADKNFLALQEQLAGIEDQLQMARRYYNGTVRNLNIVIQSFPSNLLAGMLRFREEPYFQLDDRNEAAAPGIAFASPKS
jgi:LemA protein